MVQLDETKIKSTLKDTSFDDAGNDYLLDDMQEVLDFDEVSKQVAEQLRLGNQPRSCDALYIGKDFIYLLEFKNKKSGDLKRCKPELFEKAFDSVYQYMLAYDNDISIKELTKKLRLIVIYNDAKGTNNIRADITSSKSVDKIITKLKIISKKTDWDRYPKKFKLCRLEGKLFEKVITIDISEFTASLKTEIFSNDHF